MVRQTVEGLLQKGYSVVVVDDASTDQTRQALAGSGAAYIRHRCNLGQGAAIRTGIEYALRKGASIIVTFDADGQHNAEDIPAMVAILNEGRADFVFGSRFLPGASSNATKSRKSVLRIARFINYLVSGLLLSDANNGLRAMTGKAAKELAITENRSSHNAQVQRIVKKKNLRYAECPVNVSYSAYSKKKGLRNVNSVRILYDLILYKIFH